MLSDGPTDYLAAWDLQREVHAAVVARRARHGPAARAPAGLHRRQAHRAARAARRRRRPVIDVDRGGKITFHGPGQLVGYPIVRLPDHVLVVDYVRRVEEALIGVCRDLGVTTARVPGRSGVWLRADDRGPERKIAALGIRVSRGVTMHGFALNCDVDLGWYDRFVPCGIADAGVTSLSRRARPRRDRRRGAPDRRAAPRPTCSPGRRTTPRPTTSRVPSLDAARRRRGTCVSRCSIRYPDHALRHAGDGRDRSAGRVCHTSMSDLVIETTGLRKVFRSGGRRTVAVDGLDLAVPPAACTASSGPTAPARPPRSGCCSGSPGRPGARCGSSASRSPRSCPRSSAGSAPSSSSRSSRPTSAGRKNLTPARPLDRRAPHHAVDAALEQVGLAGRDQGPLPAPTRWA